MKLDSMYQDVILDHYKNPHGRGLRDGDAEVHHVNPTCGDEITLRVKYDGGRIADVSYEGQGCSISQASASVLNDLLVGKELAEARRDPGHLPGADAVQGPDRAGRRHGGGAGGRGRVRRCSPSTPARVKCALLSWMAWKDATAQALGEDASDNTARRTA
ncbi:Fe-S cluster assembly sulfur transfer protein SufU [Streptomyces albidoflavus]